MNVIAIYAHHLCAECCNELYMGRSDGQDYLVAQCENAYYWKLGDRCPRYGIKLKVPLMHIECEVIE